MDGDGNNIVQLYYITHYLHLCIAHYVECMPLYKIYVLFRNLNLK